MKKRNIKGKSIIDFRRIGFEFRRIEKKNSPIITAALIINQSFSNSSLPFKDIIESNEYQNLLKISVILYRRFGSDHVTHFNNLISLVNWSIGNHLGEYVFIQIILGIPDAAISSEQISIACKLFPTLFEPIFISRIYTNPDLLFSSNCPKLPPNQIVTADYLVKCGANNYLIERFLDMTFNSSLNFFRQICESRRYQVLLGLLNLRPDFFSTIENICRNDLFEVVSQIMCSNLNNFLNIFLNHYKKIPSSIIKCVKSNLNPSNINQYAKKLGKQNYQNLFNFIFENEYADLIQDGLTFNDNFIPCFNNLYQKNPDLVLKIFKNTNNQVVNSTIRSILISSSNDFYSLPYSLIEAVLSKPDFSYEIQKDNPQFFIFVLNRYPCFAVTVAEIISQKQSSLNSEMKLSGHPFIINRQNSDNSSNLPMSPILDDYSKDKNTFYFDVDDLDNDAQEDIESANGDVFREEALKRARKNENEYIPNSKQLLKLIYEIDENAFCGCFSSNSNSIINILLNFVPRQYMPEKKRQHSQEFTIDILGDHDMQNPQANPQNSNDNSNNSRYHLPNMQDNNHRDSPKIRLSGNNSTNNSRYHRPQVNNNNNNDDDNNNYKHLITSKSRNGKNIRVTSQTQSENNDSLSLDIRKKTDIPIELSSRNETEQNSSNNFDNRNSEEFLLNPHHLHFPSVNFFILCENRNLLSAENLNNFFINFIDFIVNDHDWMNIIPQVPILFYQFTAALFKREDLRKHYIPLTVSFASNMFSKFRSHKDIFTTFAEFLLNNQSILKIDDFPVFMKIKIVALLASYLDNVSGPLVSLFILLAQDYRSFIALDSVSKDIILNVYINRNLDQPSCHRAFIMAYDNLNALIQPQYYIESIMKNRDAIAVTLSDDELYFEKWYNWALRGLNSSIYQTAQNMVRERQHDHDIGNNIIFEFFRSVMLNALNYLKFQNDLEFLSLLTAFLDPRSQIYSNGTQNESAALDNQINNLSLNISRSILRIVLKNKSPKTHSEDITQIYRTIYMLFITYYPYDIFNLIPIQSSFIEEQSNEPR